MKKKGKTITVTVVSKTGTRHAADRSSEISLLLGGPGCAWGRGRLVPIPPSSPFKSATPGRSHPLRAGGVAPPCSEPHEALPREKGPRGVPRSLCLRLSPLVSPRLHRPPCMAFQSLSPPPHFLPPTLSHLPHLHPCPAAPASFPPDQSLPSHLTPTPTPTLTLALTPTLTPSLSRDWMCPDLAYRG